MTNNIAVIGGGAAGLFAGANAVKSDNYSLTIIEKNKFCGKKLMITGKGRCNITNACDVKEFMSNVPCNSKFLYSVLNSFKPQDTIDFFESIGLRTKLERGKRVFPESDKAKDVRDILLSKAKENGVKIVYSEVSKIDKVNDKFHVKCGNDIYVFDKVIIATGGISYPLTGSTGDGYKFAKSFGHSVGDLSPSLVPFESDDIDCKKLMGLSLKNVSLNMVRCDNGKTVYSDFGEMIFCHFGISGPLVLSASSYVRDVNSIKYKAVIDLKPALSPEELDKRILHDFDKYKNRDFVNSLNDLLPQKMIPVIISRSGIDDRKKVNEITKDERKKLLSSIKEFVVNIKRTRPISEAIITSGGVSVKEINPKTMESKLIGNLYFAGEIIDVDAYTGGFNLQIAFSTALTALNSAIGKE